MAGIWAGYQYSLLGFLLLDTIFVVIISAQNIETGRLVGGVEKSNLYTLIVSIFSTLFLALVLWFNLTRRMSVICQVRWELIWVATMILLDIVGFASIVTNKPTADTCQGGPDSAWDICAASQGMLALLALATITLIIHACILIVLVVKLSGKTELPVWEFMAWGLPDALEPASPTSMTTTNVPLSFQPPQDGMVNVDLGNPMSKPLPSYPPNVATERPLPPPASSGRRDPFTFSSVSSLLNPAPRELNYDPSRADGVENRYQLYDSPVPVPIERPPVQRAFERVSGYIHDANAPQITTASSFSMYFAPTPVYDRFTRGSSEMHPMGSAYMPTSPASPTTRRIQKQGGRWALADEMDALERPPVGEARTLPARYGSLQARAQAQVQAPAAARTLPVRRPTRTPPRILPGSLPNPNVYHPHRI